MTRMLKIQDVTLTLFTWEGLDSHADAAYAAPPGGPRLLGLLRIVTEPGIVGHAFVGSAVQSADLDAESLIRHLKPLLVGQDALQRERLYQAMWTWKRSRLTTVRAIGAVDTALWDIAGQAAGLPIHALLGTYRTQLPAYASSQVLASPDAYAEEAARLKDLGWQAYKIHPPQAWREDIRVCQAVRRAVGETFVLMLDSMWSYSLDQAIRVGRAIEDLEYAWFEDPLAEHDLYNYVRLRQVLRIPIMATEYPAASVDAYVPWLIERGTDFLRGDVAVKGGITSLVKAAHLAEAFHLNFEIHHGANSLNNVANLHVAMAIRNCDFFEVMLPDETQKFGLVEDIQVDAQGFVHAPVRPGLGVQIDFDRIARLQVGVLA